MAIGIAQSIKQSLTRTRNAVFSRIAGLLHTTEVTDATWDELEELLIQADVGVDTTLYLVERLRTRVRDEAILRSDALQQALGQELRALLPEIRYLLHDDSAKTRRLALETIGALGDSTMVPAVAELVLDDNEAVQLTAVRALADLGGQDATEQLRDRLVQVRDEDLAEEMEDLWEEITEEEL